MTDDTMDSSGMRSFSLNGLIGLRVIGAARYLAYFDNEYRRISRPAPDDYSPSVTLEIVDRLEAGDTKEILYKGLFRFRYQLETKGCGSTLIRFERHWLDRVYTTAVGAFVQGQLLEPVLYLKLLQKNVLLMHAAGVARDGDAFVFPAHGGTGKTTLSLALMQMGYELLGDDLLMVETTSGLVHPHARPLHLFSYNLRSLSVPLRIRVAIATKSVLRRLIQVVTGRKFLISTRVHADEIMPVRFGEASFLRRIVFLRREGSAKTLDLSDAADRAEAVEMVIDSADLNESLARHIGFSEAQMEMERRVVEAVLTRAGSMSVVNGRALKSDADRAEFARAYL